MPSVDLPNPLCPYRAKHQIKVLGSSGFATEVRKILNDGNWITVPWTWDHRNLWAKTL